MRTFLLAVLVACGHGQQTPSNVVDGGVDGTADAAPDGPPPPCPSVDDRDGDGICDAVDVCPDVYDPGQADLDHDGIGWMCDPVESTTLDAHNINGLSQWSIHHDTFAARTLIACPVNYDQCQHEELQVSAAGVTIAHWDSTDPNDAWQAVGYVTGPYVTPQDRVLWSRGYDSGDTGELDLATHQFTVRANGIIWDDPDTTQETVVAGNELLALGLETSSGHGDFFDIAADGSLDKIASNSQYASIQDAIMVPGATPRALVPDGYNALRLYSQGAPALADILVDNIPLTGVGIITPVQNSGQPAGFCMTRGSQVIVVDWDSANAIRGRVLPQATTCTDLTIVDRGATRFYEQFGNIVYDHQGTLRSIAAGVAPQIVGDALPIVVADFNNVWLVDTDGTNRLIATNLDTPQVGINGTTINILAHHGDANGTYDLTRIRGTDAPVSVQIVANTPNGTGIHLVTAANGAALISATDGLHGVVVASNTMTPTPAPFANFTGGVVTGHSLVFGDKYGTGTAYLYDEDTGSPRFTALAPTGQAASGEFLAGTDWFVFYTSGTCMLARFRADNTLHTEACTSVYGIAVLGTRANGELVISDDTGVFALGQDTVTHLANHHGGGSILDGNTLVGWTGGIDVGHEFACLAMHPERCWNYETTFPSTVTRMADGPDRFAVVIQLFTMVNSVKAVIVRSIGPGNYTP